MSNIYLEEIRTVNKILFTKHPVLIWAENQDTVANKHCVILSSNLTLEATSKAVLSCLRRGALHLSKVSRHNIVQGKVSRTGLVGKAHLDSLRVYRIKVYIQLTQTLMDREVFQLLLFHALTKISGYIFFLVTHRLLKVCKKVKKVSGEWSTGSSISVRKKYTHHHLLTIQWAEHGFAYQQAVEDTLNSRHLISQS